MGQEMCKVNCDENEKQETVLAAHSTPRAADEAKIQTRTVNSQEVLSTAGTSIPTTCVKAWEVSIHRHEGASLGMELRPQKYMQHYIVVGIILDNSEVMKFNASNPGSAIKTGDRIIDVNGVHQDPRGMVDTFFSTKGAATFKIRLERYNDAEA
jgi:hypothetical protein